MTQRRNAKVTPEIRATIATLRAEGMSLRGIADKLGADGVVELSGTAVDNVLRELQRRPELAKTPVPAVVDAGPIADLPPLPPLPDGASVAARAVHAQLADVRGRIAALPPDADWATSYASLARVALQTAKALDALLPPPPPDPERDPCNAAARVLITRQATATITSVIDRARRLPQCPICGRGER